jgi:hypothetical protein
VEFQIVFPGLAWWREVYDMPHDLWQAYREIAEQRLRR